MVTSPVALEFVRLDLVTALEELVNKVELERKIRVEFTVLTVVEE